MSSTRSTQEVWGPHLAKAVRAIRKARGLSAAQMAAMMGIDRRNYTNFESGKGRLYVARVLKFAEVTDSDPLALLGGVLMGAPNLASGAVDNKLVLSFFLLLVEFETAFGDRIRLLDTGEVIAAFRDAFSTLETSVNEKHARQQTDWLRDGIARLGLGRPKSTRSDEPT